MKRTVLVACVAALSWQWGVLEPILAAPQNAVSSPSLPSDARIREMLAERVDVQHRSTGIVVGIVTPDGRRVIPYGRFGRDDSRPLTGDTVFEIGSVTKVFTSALLDRAFFVAENTRVTVTFEADPDGHVARLLLRSPDGETRATRVEGR